jgi:hypothetical protein
MPQVAVAVLVVCCQAVHLSPLRRKALLSVVEEVARVAEVLPLGLAETVVHLDKLPMGAAVVVSGVFLQVMAVQAAGQEPLVKISHHPLDREQPIKVSTAARAQSIQIQAQACVLVEEVVVRVALVRVWPTLHRKVVWVD